MALRRLLARSIGNLFKVASPSSNLLHKSSDYYIGLHLFSFSSTRQYLDLAYRPDNTRHPQTKAGVLFEPFWNFDIHLLDRFKRFFRINSLSSSARRWLHPCSKLLTIKIPFLSFITPITKFATETISLVIRSNRLLAPAWVYVHFLSFWGFFLLARRVSAKLTECTFFIMTGFTENGGFAGGSLLVICLLCLAIRSGSLACFCFAIFDTRSKMGWLRAARCLGEKGG